MNQNKTISWLAPEYIFREKTNDWFWAVIIIVASGGIASIIYKNYFFAIFLILASILLTVFSIRKPDIIEHVIDETGVKIKDEEYTYKNMVNFWIDKNHPHKRLLIKTTNFLTPLLDIILPDDVSEEELKTLLSANIKEEEIKEPLGHKFIEFLGF